MAPIPRFVNWDQWIQKFNAFRKRRFIRFGVPFFVLVFGGSFYLRQFTDIRYKYKPKVFIRPEDVKKVQEMKKPEKVTLESEYEKIKEADIDHWENVRIYRPWEDPEDTTEKK